MIINNAPINTSTLGVDNTTVAKPKVVLTVAQSSMGTLPAVQLTVAQSMAGSGSVSGKVLMVAQTVGVAVPDRVLTVAQRVVSQRQISGTVLMVSQRCEAKVRRVLMTFAQTVLDKRGVLPYRPSTHIDGAAYQIRVMIGETEVNPCRLFSSMSVTFSENDSAKATLNVLEPHGDINLYEFYNQNLRIFVQTADNLTCIYTGIVDIPAIDLQTRKMTLTATNDRKDRLNKLDKKVVARIGFWAQSIFGEKEDYKNQAAEVDDRMTTIPSALDFDANGQGWLTPWKPKAMPDFTIGDCNVYTSGTALSLGSASGIINTVNIKLGNRFERLFHRPLAFSYAYQPKEAFGQLPCYIGYEGPPPKYDDVLNAAKGAGWGVGYFKSEGTPQPGWYDCGIPTYWRATAYTYDYEASGSVDANGNPIMNVIQTGVDGNTSDLYCMTASWLASKRWRQSVEEKYDIVLSNEASIKFHGKKEDALSYTISHDADKNEIAKHWEDNDGFAAPYGTLQSNGDYTTNVDNVIDGEFARASECAFNVGYTKILESHRQNTFTADCKLIPWIGLRHTAYIKLKQFKGLVKIKEYTHNIDFRSKRGHTEVVGAFYKNPLAQNEDDMTLWSVSKLKRPVLPLAVYQRQHVLSDYIVPFGAEIVENDDENTKVGSKKPVNDNKPVFGTGKPKFLLYKCAGFVRKETGYYFRRHKVKRPYAFRVIGPDIEDASRDTAELEAGTTPVPVNVFDGKIEVRL